jgi:hypothetical protein
MNNIEITNTLKITLTGDAAYALIRWIGITSQSQRREDGLSDLDAHLMSEIYARIGDDVCIPDFPPK